MEYRGQVLAKWECSHCFSDVVSSYEVNTGQPTSWFCVNTECKHHAGTYIPDDGFEPDWTLNRLLDKRSPFCRSTGCRREQKPLDKC